MDMNQKRKERQKKPVANEENQNRVNINWYPGHMTKAKRDIQANLKVVDMIIELRDARIPLSSKNPMIEQIIQQKPRLIILTKRDKADQNQTDKWIKQLTQENVKVMAVDNFNDNVKQVIIEHSKSLMNAMIDRMIRKGIRPRAIRAMVLGIPNVGKSTLINRIVERKIAVTSDRPGVTRALKWVKLNSELELLDTPGILWPKLDNQTVAMNLAIVGSINDQILPMEEVAYQAIKQIMNDYPGRLKKRYDVDESISVYNVFEEIAKKRKWIMANQQVDQLKTSTMLLNELRDGLLGAYTLERVSENAE